MCVSLMRLKVKKMEGLSALQTYIHIYSHQNLHVLHPYIHLRALHSYIHKHIHTHPYGHLFKPLTLVEGETVKY